MIKIIKVGNKSVKFKATAAIPRLYRMKFGRDIIKDIGQLHKSFANAKATEEEQLSMLDLEIFENCAYIMAKHAAPDDVPSDAEEWLDGFEVFSVYQILPEILMLWGANVETTIESKKKLNQLAGK